MRESKKYHVVSIPLVSLGEGRDVDEGVDEVEKANKEQGLI